MKDIVDRLRDFGQCNDSDVDEAADEIERLRDEISKYNAIGYDADQRNIGSDITARLLRQIAITGVHDGVFGGAEQEGASQCILNLHREKQGAEERIRIIYNAISHTD